MTMRFVLMFFLCLTTSYASAAGITLYVSPNGNDAWSGRSAAPNGVRSDGPFATIRRAQEAARIYHKGTSGAVIVRVRGGVYALSEPLVFTPEDSGVTYAAYGKEKPIISGGTRITGWQKTANGWWTTQLPEVAEGKWNFMQLWVNDQRRYRPRATKESYFHIAAELPPSDEAKGKGFDRIKYHVGDIRSDWSNLTDVEVLIMQTWTMTRMRMKKVDEGAQSIQFTGHTAGTEWWAALPAGNRYIVENVREALGTPGDFYLDRPSGTLTYVPMPDEDPDKAEIYAPKLEQLVLIKGDTQKRSWVDHLNFTGITFAHANWVTPAEGNAFAQAEANLPGVISAVGARDCAFERSAVKHIGIYAIDLGKACKRCRVENCELTDMAAGGVKIGEMGVSAETEEITSDNVVSNCLIAHGGRMHPAAVGVWIGQSPNNKVEHNEIADLYYTGISAGWTWGYGPSLLQNNSIAYNHIHDLGQGVLSDMGGIYTLGNAKGTVLDHNLIHDVNCFTYGGWGIYFDEGTTEILAQNNICYNMNSAPFHQHYGKENRVINNIWAFGKDAQLMRTRVEEHKSFTMERNIVYFRNAPLLGSNWSGNNYTLDNNVYWDASGASFNFGGLSVDEWRKKGQDTHSVIADPLFEAVDRYNFKLKTDSPALKLGFKQIDMSKVGPSPRRVSALQPVARAFPAPPPVPPIHDDFEDTPVGSKAALATTSEENDKATVRVTDEVAASGKRSLKFIDAPGQKDRYNPHIHYNPGLTKGIIVGSFDVMLKADAVLSHEWRDAANPYHTGPSVRVEADGAVMVGGKKVTTLPRGVWVHFEISCGVGDKMSGKWDMSIKLPGRVPALRLKNLPCSRDFSELKWYGFVSDASTDAVFYIDNIDIKSK